jgi:glycosyltransferase involved in cell wall biosynthesis
MGGGLRICVYAISKNEEMFVERFCEAAKDADMIMIADTGSTDKTVELAKQNGCVVHDIFISPWRFDLARNAALALIPRDFDVCVSLDLDEILQEGWREEIESVWKKGETTRLRYFFDWGVGIKFKYEKIHSRHGYRWHHPCHEYPVPDGRIKEVWADTDMLLVIHKPDPTKSRGQYLDLLKVSIEEDPLDPRNAFYYARELSFHAQWEDSIKECDRYLALPRADWPNERCYAYRVKGRCFSELGNLVDAEKAFMMAAFEAPNTREPWCELAMLYYRQQRWSECFAMAMRTLQIQHRELVYTVDPAVWGAQPHDLASISAWHLGLKSVSVAQAQLALDKEPDNVRLQENLRFVSEDLSISEVDDGPANPN